MSDETRGYDYVIVGAGSAGSVLANRLTSDPDVRVLVLEAGPKDRSIFIHMPAAFSEPLKSDRLNWAYETEPEPWMDGRRMYCPRGKVVGGSSSINGMVYIRGHALDYDRWASKGLEGWDYAHCLPYFRRATTHELGPDEYRGGDGPVHVAAGRQEHPLYAAWIEAGLQAGYEYTEDVNGYRQEGIGPFDRTTVNGERCSAAKAYIHPIKDRPNLEIRTGCLAHRVIFEGDRAVGVAYGRGLERHEVFAEREVILCGGAINSPHLLQLSGIGPADRLREVGVPVVADLPGVGENLQDHLEIYVQYRCTQPISLYPALKPLGRLKVGLQWIFGRKGPGATNHFEAGGFVRSRPGIRHPNLQHHFLPLAINYDGSSPASGHGFQAHVGPMRPTSRGYVRIRSADPEVPPAVLFNYMSTDNDRQEMREAVRLTREIIHRSAFDPYRGPELNPGAKVETDEEIDAFVRSHGESAYHPSCSCAMGPASDPMAVVDAEARVHGVEGLRVVDTSVMPDLVSGNTDAPTIMLAEKLSDAIRGVDPLPPSDAPTWVHPEWETTQR
ncbi:MAG: choline dehydrogenase [Myxococcota bacterium]